MGLEHNRLDTPTHSKTGTQLVGYTMGLEHDWSDTQWDWNTIGLKHNQTGTQIGLIHNGTGTQLV